MANKKEVLLNIIFVLSVLPAGRCTVPPVVDPTVFTQSKTIGDCQACNKFIESFNKGLERTARGKYEGGDAAWEEEKLKKSYKRSELRLVDIQDGLCKEDSKYSVQCHHMAERAEEFIEEWWSQAPDESTDLHTDICIEKLKVCCPPHHYGKDCLPCPGDHANLCNGNGKCRGDGTRKGNGTCLCDTGYSGDNCDQCDSGSYLSYQDDNKILCSPCHKSCTGGCREGTRKDCVACKPGYIFDSDKGCLDINECNDDKICTKDEFCLNSLGSYECMACDKSCNGCIGDGPDLCNECAKDYTKKEDFCISNRQENDPSDVLTTTRYITYIGLLIATGILIPKSNYLGSIVGGLVFAYIMCAEYYCMINGHAGFVNLKNFDLMQLFHVVDE